MAKIEKTYILGKNEIYKGHKGIINIIGSQPNDVPYVLITVQDRGNQIYSSWIKDNDLERFAINILKALNSKHLKVKQ